MKNTPLYFVILSAILHSVSLNEDAQLDWVVTINGNEADARKLANDHGFEFLGQVGNIEATYHFREKKNFGRRTKRSVVEKTKRLIDEKTVIWTEHQKPLLRQKRSLISADDFDTQSKEDNKVKEMFNDPGWPKQWYLYDDRLSSESFKQDLHVIPVWRMNITGRGIKVTIIDDGLDHTHSDIKDNYDPLSSTDLNDNDDDPMPNLGPGTNNEHGTRCASEVSMIANNSICGVGIAFNAKIGGIRVLDGQVTDVIEAKALGFRNNHIDIYSASWGPLDDGKSMEKPGKLVQQALFQGTSKGRNGKGNLYVWASGNGGYYNDSCACDGYASSIYAISINSISPNSTELKYSERCSSTMAATFSTSFRFKSRLVAADVRGQCTDQHSGTSASAPLAAGIFALALEANPNLTWRDVKHLLAWTSQVSVLKNRYWKENNAGFIVNEAFGFGQIDAMNLVTHAKSWVTVPELASCTLTTKKIYNISNLVSKVEIVDGSSCFENVKYIENIVIQTTFKYSSRGALQITFESPHGMITTLLPPRGLDKSNTKMVDWLFNTVHNWGEDPRGLWKIKFEDKASNENSRYGVVEKIAVTFYGTKTLPYHVKVAPNNRRLYNKNYNSVKNSKRHFRQNRNE